MSRTTTIQPFPNFDEELSNIKRSRDLQITENGNGIAPGCRFDLTIPRDVWDRIKSDESEVYKFLREDATDGLMKAYLHLSKVNLPRDRGIEFGCSINHEGKVSCGIKGSL